MGYAKNSNKAQVRNLLRILDKNGTVFSKFGLYPTGYNLSHLTKGISENLEFHYSKLLLKLHCVGREGDRGKVRVMGETWFKFTQLN